MEHLKEHLRKYWADKRGSFVIFVTMIFLSSVIFTTAVIQASVQTGVQSSAESLGYLWGQSILAEYDRFLFDRYSIIAFSGDEYETAEKIDYYAEYTFEDKKYVRYDNAEVNLEGYEITDQVNFRSQVERAVATGAKPIPQYRTESGDSAEGEIQNATTSGNRYVSAEWIIDELPSRKNRTSANVQSIISAIKDSASLGSVVAIPFINSYIMKYFKNHLSEEELGDTFFNNEVECIITGSLKDKTAYEEVKAILYAVREISNISHIHKSEKKKSAILAIAAVLFPEVPLVLSRELIIDIWATAETANDMNLIEAGNPVPLVKKDQNFALSLDNVLKGVTSSNGMTSSGTTTSKDTASANQDGDNTSKVKGYVEPDVLEGETYEDYLRLILTFIPEKTIVNRILDIIQINAKYLYTDYFNINRCYTGLDYCFTVNGRKHEFTQKY